MKLLLAVIAVAIVLSVLATRQSTEQYMSKSEIGDSWPLSVDGGLLSCIDASAIVFETGGKKYALNGTARSSRLTKQLDLRPLEEIWLESPSFKEFVDILVKNEGKTIAQARKALGTPTRVSIGVLIRAGLALCP